MFAGRPIGRALLAGVAAAMFAAACGGSGSGSPTAVDVGSGSLTGAGATFPAPFYQKAFFDYNAKYPQVTVNYQAVGQEPASRSSRRAPSTSARATSR